MRFGDGFSFIAVKINLHFYAFNPLQAGKTNPVDDRAGIDRTDDGKSGIIISAIGVVTVKIAVQVIIKGRPGVGGPDIRPAGGNGLVAAEHGLRGPYRVVVGADGDQGLIVMIIGGIIHDGAGDDCGAGGPGGGVGEAHVGDIGIAAGGAGRTQQGPVVGTIGGRS